MGDCPAGFHDSDNSCLGLVIPIGDYSFMSLFVLCFGFLGLDLVDLDAIFRIGEIFIHGECIAVVDVLAFGPLR